MCIPFAVCGMGPYITIQQGDQAVAQAFGEYKSTFPPGLYEFNICTDKFTVLTEKTLTCNLSEQVVMTRDNLTVIVNGVLIYRIVEPTKALFEVADYNTSIYMLAQCQLRTVIGEVTLEDLFADLPTVKSRLQELVEVEAAAWGLHVENIDLKDIR